MENRLSSVTLPNSGGVVNFTYDPFGRRIQKSTAGATTVYVYDGANIVGEYDGSGALLTKYAQGAGIEEPLAMNRQGSTVYYNADGLGSITSLDDASGAPVATYQYDAFGESLGTTGNVVNSFRYTGREWDQETGLYYYRARYYESNSGRFLSADPIDFRSGDENFYRYVRNTPTRWTDPSGLKVYRCKRKAIVDLFGVNINIFGFTHHWIRTDTKEAGLGPGGGGVPGVPGQPGAQDTPIDAPGEPTTINDHTGASNLLASNVRRFTTSTRIVSISTFRSVNMKVHLG